MFVLHLHQPQRQRFKTAYDYSRLFERHLGRRLQKAERTLIYNLEKARLTGRPCRCHIVDHSDFDSRPLLIAYLSFLDPSGTDTVIVGRTRPEAQALLPRKSPFRAFSAHSKYGIRGHTYRYALALDTHAYAPQLRSAILPALTGTVLIAPNTMIIVHSRGFSPGFLPEAFASPESPPRFGIIRCSSPDRLVDIIIELLPSPPLLKSNSTHTPTQSSENTLS